MFTMTDAKWLQKFILSFNQMNLIPNAQHAHYFKMKLNDEYCLFLIYV